MNIKKFILVFFMLLNILVVSAQAPTEGVCKDLNENECKASIVYINPSTSIILHDGTSQDDLNTAKTKITEDFTYAIDLLTDYKVNLEDAQSQGLFGTFGTVDIFPDYGSVISELDSKIGVFNGLKDNIMSQGTGSELRALRASARVEWMGLILIERYAYLRIQPARLANLNDGTADDTLRGEIDNYLLNHFNTYPEYSMFVNRALDNENMYDGTPSDFVQSWTDSANEWGDLWFARLAEIAPGLEEERVYK